jgi:excinuclease ABC subunit B
MKKAISETDRRRAIQLEFNKKNKLVPKTITKPIEEQTIIIKDTKHIPKKEKEKLIPVLEKEMRQAAEQLDFELAIALRDQLKALENELKINKDEDL